MKKIGVSKVLQLVSAAPVVLAAVLIAGCGSTKVAEEPAVEPNVEEPVVEEIVKPKIIETDFECYREQLTIRGVEVRPEGVEGLPVAVVSHGFMSTKARTIGYARQLAEWGFAAYCFDFCGGSVESTSDGETTEMSVLTEKRDLEAVIEYAQDQSYTDSSKLVLMGCSQGGFVSALAAVELGDAVSALVLFYPAFCIPDDARRGVMVEARFDPDDIPDMIDCGPMMLGWVYPTAVIDMDVAKEIAPYTGPVFLAHGTADELVGVSYAKDAYQTYTEGNPEDHPEKELLLLENAQHGFTDQENEQAMDAVKAFLSKNGFDLQ